MDFWCKSSAERVYKHTRKQKADCARINLHTGKNMCVSAQLLLREVEDTILQLRARMPLTSRTSRLRAFPRVLRPRSACRITPFSTTVCLIRIF